MKNIQYINKNITELNNINIKQEKHEVDFCNIINLNKPHYKINKQWLLREKNNNYSICKAKFLIKLKIN